MQEPAPISVANRARRAVALRLLPFIFALYIIAYLDRANISFAKLPMSEELDFNDDVYGFGAGIFFIGYLALEIPGALLVERWSARRWMARILITWGLCTALIGMVKSANQFYWARFALGLAEAGFYPGIIVYVTHWFTLRDRARAMTCLILAIPIAMGFGAAISTAILQLDWFGLPGWRWLFFLEGLPAVLLGFVTLFYLTDRPDDARWLKSDDRDWLKAELEAERLAKRDTAHVSVLQALRHYNVVLLAVSLFVANVTTSVFVFWLPDLIKHVLGFSNVWATLGSGLPYAAGFLGALGAGYYSDRTGRRKLFTIAPMIVAAIGLTAGVQAALPSWLMLLFLCVAGAALYAYPTSFWVLPTLTLQGSAAAASIGTINSIGNLSGFFGPTCFGYLLSHSFSYAQLVPILSLCTLTSAALVAALRIPAVEPSAAKGNQQLPPPANAAIRAPSDVSI